MAAAPIPNERPLREYLRPVRARAGCIVLAMALVPAGALLASSMQTASYEATAQVFPSQVKGAGGADAQQQRSSGPARGLKTQAELAHTPAVAAPVLAATSAERRSVRAFLKASTVSAASSGDSLMFSVRDQDPRLAQRLATEYAHQYTVYVQRLAQLPIAQALAELRPAGSRAPLRQTHARQALEQLSGSAPQVVSSADAAAKVSPLTARNVLGGLLLGAVFGLGLAFLWEALDTRVRSSSEISDALGLPELGPGHARFRRSRRRSLRARLRGRKGQVGEALGFLRANVLSASVDGGARTIMVTSAQAAEGKSAVAADLAGALASAGRDVTLVDLDLAEPSLARSFDLKGHPGVTDVARGAATLDEALATIPTRAALPGGALRVLASGSPPPDVGAFYRTREVDSILAGVRSTSEFAVVDSAPLLGVDSAVALAGKVDAILMVARPSSLRRPRLATLQRVLATCPAEKLGFVVTRPGASGLRRADPRRALPWAAAALGSIALGVGVALNLQVSFLLVLVFLGVGTLAAPAGAWVLGALVAALTFRGLVQLGALPSVATFVDLPLAWGALAVGLLKRGERSRFLTRQLRWLGALAAAVALAWAFHPSEVLRPVLYLALLGEPFAIVAALLLDPPTPRMRRALERTLLALVVIQIPLAALQLATLGSADHIQGSLYGAGAGAHVISGVIVVGAIWILARQAGSSLFAATRLPLVIALMIIPFIADAKQVILATPAVLLAAGAGASRGMAVARSVLVAASVVALFFLAPAGNTTEKFIERSGQGQGGKQATADFVWSHIHQEPPSIAFGLGPAETVSRAAFMTTDLFQRGGSPLATLGLKPATLAVQAQGTALEASGGGSSFNGGESSALGVVGDLGFFGILVYAGLVLSLFVSLRRERSPEGVAAAAGLAMFVVLGLFFDWWEQPPFGVFIAVLAGLSLTRGSEPRNGAGQPETGAGKLVPELAPNGFTASTSTRR